jgi:hypothetical protein
MIGGMKNIKGFWDGERKCCLTEGEGGRREEGKREIYDLKYTPLYGT